MAQTNRQKHSSTFLVRSGGAGNLGTTFALAKFLDFDQNLALSDTLKARARRHPMANCDVAPFRASVHGPNKQTEAFINILGA